MGIPKAPNDASKCLQTLTIFFYTGLGDGLMAEDTRERENYTDAGTWRHTSLALIYSLENITKSRHELLFSKEIFGRQHGAGAITIV